jgi:hypothetical protein
VIARTSILSSRKKFITSGLPHPSSPRDKIRDCYRAITEVAYLFLHPSQKGMGKRPGGTGSGLYKPGEKESQFPTSLETAVNQYIWHRDQSWASQAPSKLKDPSLPERQL